MKKALLYITIIVFALGGCKKVDLDEVTSGDPVFTASATLDVVTQLNFVAGDDDFYMFSEFSKDSFEVYSMTGRFAKDANCQNDCEESLSFSIRSSYLTPDVSDFIFENAVSILDSNYYFSTNNNTEINGHIYSFTGELIDTVGGVPASSYTWTISTDQVETFSGNIVDFDYFGSANLDVLLTANTPNGCDSYFRTTVTNGGLDFCDLFVEVIDTFGNFVELIPSSNNGLDSFFWNDSLFTQGSYVISPSQIQNGLIKLEALSPNSNCNAELGICVDGSFNGISSVAYPQFDLEINDTTMIVGNGEQFSAVTIEYQDATGIYSSKFADNSDPNNTFTITKIEDYDNNENGEKTRKLTIDYNCILKKESSGEEKKITGTAEIAVAYPD
ncbi:MAG: hypothetical protein AB8F94_15865 [Saprospiraceae bacterium]